MSDYFLVKQDQNLAIEVLSAALYSLFPKSRIYNKEASEFGFSLEVLLDHELDDLSLVMIKKRYQEFVLLEDMKISEMMSENAIEFLKHERLFDLAKAVNEENTQLVSIFSFMGYHSLASSDIDVKRKEKIKTLSLDTVSLLKKDTYQSKSKYLFKINAKAAISECKLVSFENEYNKRKRESHIVKASQLGFLEPTNSQKSVNHSWTVKGLNFKMALIERINSLRFDAGFKQTVVKFDTFKENAQFFKTNDSKENRKLCHWKESKRLDYNLDDGLLNTPLSLDNLGYVFLENQDAFQEIALSLELTLAYVTSFSLNIYFEISAPGKIHLEKVSFVKDFLDEHNVAYKDVKIASNKKSLTISAFVSDAFGRFWRVSSLKYLIDQNILYHVIHNVDRLFGLNLENLNSPDSISKILNKKLKNNISKIALSVNL